MTRLALILGGVLVAVALAGSIGIFLGLPYMERRWTFSPAKPVSADSWHMPADASKVAFPTSDGVRLAGWYFDGAKPRNGITVLVLHGSRGVLSEYVVETQTLQALGFNVLLFNFRGFGDSEGRSLGEVTLGLDGAAALRYLTRERGVDPQSIALLGISLGAAVAADLATTSPCRAVALIGAFESAREQARRIKPWMPAFVFDFLSSPFDTIGKIDEANCPVLVVHGANDNSVPLEQAEAIFEAARPPKRLIVVPSAEHTMSDAAIQGFLDELAMFFIQRR